MRLTQKKEKNKMSTHSLAYKHGTTLVDYGLEIENEIVRLQEMINTHDALILKYQSRWLAIKLLEEDHLLQKSIADLQGGQDLLREVDKSIAHLQAVYGDDVDTIIADRRYGWINGLVKEVVKHTRTDQWTVSDKIDRILTSRLLGIPIFLFMMWIVFKMTTDLSGPMLDWVDGVFAGPISLWVIGLMGWVGLGGSWVESLLVDGIIAGVGGVLVFVPVMAFLYLALALLEDSGYMARAAFVMDRLMHGLGLHGKSFLPMIVGFGCTVPALMATRTLENEKDRVLTGLLVPFMSCGARLPVYVLLASIFFPGNSGMVIFWIYVLGIVVAILLGLLLKNTLFKDKELSPFVMELPPYRIPTFKAIWFHMWERTSAFIKKAASIILITSVVIWLLLSIPVGGGVFAETPVGDSAFAVVSEGVATIFKPLGFGEWQMSGPLLTGFVAKEVVVSTMSQVFDVADFEDVAEKSTFFEGVGEILVSFINAVWDTIKSIPLIIGIDLFEEDEEIEPTGLMAAIQESFDRSSNGHGALASVAYMAFVLLYTPCMVAVAAAKKELGTKWMWFSVVGQLVIAWVAAFIIFQGGILFGLG
jgi:ferrous iron transport protein B